MKTLRILYHLALADFFERVRRTGFLLILAAVIVLGLLVNNGTLGMDLGQGATDAAFMTRYHGELNSAWVGTMTVMVVNTFLGLFGFYLVSDSIKRDVHTGVGQIIATTPLRRATYLLGKWLSNFAVLAVLVLILALAAVIMVLLQSEAALDLGVLLMPFLVVALPNLALTAALAVFFETVPWLRGALGNVIYFFMWGGLVVLWQFTAVALPSFQDPLGTNIVSQSFYASAIAAFPNDPIKPGLSVGGFNIPGTEFKLVPWSGVDWTLSLIAGQWVWVIIGLGLILLSALWFARFDPSREGLLRRRATAVNGEESPPAGLRIRLPKVALPSLSPLISKLAQGSPFLGVLFAELRMLLNGRRWWWWAITAGLSFGILSSSTETVRDYLLPAAWLWPLTIWSEMGSREKQHNTHQFVFASARPVLRQLPAAWLAGVLATALLCVAAALYFILNGDLPGLAGWAGAVIFVPTLALTLGVFSSGSRLFEVIYVLWWYAGVWSQAPAINFTAGAPLVYLLAAAGLLLLTAFWRGRQVRV